MAFACQEKRGWGGFRFGELLATLACRRVPGDQGLVGCYSVDAADLVDGSFQDFFGVMATERCHDIELSGDNVSFEKVREALQLVKNLTDRSLHLPQCEGYGLFPFSFASARRVL